MPLDTTLDDGLVEKISDWEPVEHPVPDATLDGRPMQGTTKLEHSVLVESLDSRLREGRLSPEPLEQSVLNTLLVGRPMEGYTETISPERSAPAAQLDYGKSNLQKLFDWEPPARPVPGTTLDGRLMEGTTYLDLSALGVSLDSGLMEGTSSLEPLEQSVLNTLSAAWPEEGITEELSDREPVVLPVPDITLDGRPMEGTYGGELLHVESLSRPMVNAALDRRPMEGIPAPLPVELSGLALAPDRGHVEYSPSSRPLEQAVLFHADPADQHAAVGTLSLSDCCPAGPAGPAGPCVTGGPVGPDDCLQVMEPFGHSVPDHTDPATVGPLEHSVLDMEMRNDNLDSSNEPQFGSYLGQFNLELEDAIRREVLMSWLMGRVSANDVNGLLLSPENTRLGDKEMSRDEVRSEGLRQWKMDMDVEYQYETFNGLPVYYSGDMYDSEDDSRGMLLLETHTSIYPSLISHISWLISEGYIIIRDPYIYILH